MACGLLLGCGEDDGSRNFAVTRDSAGVAIVNTSDAAWEDIPRWTVADSAEIRIGVVEGDTVYELRLALGAVRMRDGRIVVANAGSSELRIYDAEGRHLQSTGRDGEGPGEFRNIGNLWLYRADSLAVYDRSLRRVSVFDSEVSFVRSFSLASPGEGITPSPVDVFPDGALLVLGAAAITPSLGSGIHRRRGPLLRYASGGSGADTITFVLGEEWVGIDGADGPVLTRRPFARNSYVAAVGNAIAVADAETYEVMLYSAEGNLFRRIRRSGGNRPLTPDELEQFVQSRVDAARSREAAIRTRVLLRDTPMPATYPAFVGMLVDNDENIWLEETRAPDDVVRRYSVLRRDGQFVGRVAMPNGLRPIEIGFDYVLGRFVDELGVEFIQIHDLTRRD